jgi:hypothetical protein
MWSLISQNPFVFLALVAVACLVIFGDGMRPKGRL